MLTVSREVERDFIVDFPVDQRFIKLPVENYLRLLDWEGKNVWEETNRAQIALINAINDPKYRFVCAALSRRLGKTFIANVIAQLVSLVPDCHILIMSPNYNLSGISFELQRKLIKKFDLEVAKNNLKDKVIELENGSTIRMGSISTVDSCVGRSYNLILYDEAALSEGGEESFNISLRPTLDRPNSKAIFISTPRGRLNWFSRFYDRGFSDKYPEWVSLHADYTENSRMAESDVAEARRTMSAAEFEQEYMASFNVFEGRIYNFDRANICEYEWQSGDEVFAGLDPGYKDPTAFAVIVYRPSEDCFWVIDEFVQNAKTTAEHASKIKELVDKYNLDPIFIDSAAAQFAADLAYIYDIGTIRGKKQVLEGIAYVQTIVETGRLKVTPNCTHTLGMLDQYRWDTRETLTTEKPKHDEYSHIADAIRYALYTYTI